MRKGIISDPIVLKIYGETCPDLSIVDLPGITKIPMKGSDHPNNIEEITTELILKYINHPQTIILCVSQCNVDITTSDSLKITRNMDPDGHRSLVVLTKIDLADSIDSVIKILNNDEINLRYGFIGTKGRSQKDINNGVTVVQGLKNEQVYIDTMYKDYQMRDRHLGTKALVEKLTSILSVNIMKSLPLICQEVKVRLLEFE